MVEVMAGWRVPAPQHLGSELMSTVIDEACAREGWRSAEMRIETDLRREITDGRTPVFVVWTPQGVVFMTEGHRLIDDDQPIHDLANQLDSVLVEASEVLAERPWLDPQGLAAALRDRRPPTGE